MISTFRFVPVFGGATALLLAVGLTPALANGDSCAAYGPGFTSVEGSDTCIRIGGHVRVEAGTRITSSSVDHGWANGGARPASLHTESNVDNMPVGTINSGDFGRSHLRVPQSALGYADPLH